MKRLLSVILCVFLLSGLFSCGNGNDTLSGDTEEPQKPEQTTGEYVSSVFEGVVIFPDEGEIKNNKISPEEAIEIAREKFEYPPDREGATGTVIVYSIKVLNNPNRFYHVVLQAQRYERDTYYAGGEPYKTTYLEEIFVSTSSGFAWWGIKDVGQELDVGNSPISIDEAERIASEYWGICEGDRPSPESEYVYRITAETADDGIYRVVRRLVYENGVVTEQVGKSYDIYVAAYTGCVFSLNGK